MLSDMSQLEKMLYCGKYTAASYIDAIVSMPIWAADKAAKVSEMIFAYKTPKFFSWEQIQKESPVYNYRKNLRASLDTKPGVLFLQSNILGSILFIAAGMPAAEFAHGIIEDYISNAPELVKYATNSLSTLSVQMLVWYTMFMVNEIRVNKEKYISENGRLSIKRIGIGLKNAAKAFLSFDLIYTGSKVIGQSTLLAKGSGPWQSSGIFDVLSGPVWYTVAVSFGLKNDIIETKQTREWHREKNNKTAV